MRLLQYPVVLAYLENARFNKSKKKIRILDVGTSSSSFCSYLAQKGYQVTAIDLDADAIKKQKEISRFFKIPYNALQMDARELEFQDNSFDVIFCISTLEHIKDDVAAIMQLYRVLKKP